MLSFDTLVANERYTSLPSDLCGHFERSFVQSVCMQFLFFLSSVFSPCIMFVFYYASHNKPFPPKQHYR